MPTILVTGAHGLVGSAVVERFAEANWKVVGIDNNARAEFFGSSATTYPVGQRLLQKYDNFRTVFADICNEEIVEAVFRGEKIDAVVHTAGQPSHDWATSNPLRDMQVNLHGTQLLLEATRRNACDAPFVFLSTNKVYGDNPNKLPLIEHCDRFELADPWTGRGIDESMSIDHCDHSLFGVSKTAADLLVQEYGRCYGMSTVALRCGCITGPQHAGVELHGFLSYLVSCAVRQKLYRIYGYKGKQVRDNIDARDLAELCWQYVIQPPRRTGEVYNVGGGFENSISIQEAFQTLERKLGYPAPREYVDNPRRGDHICYYTEMRALRARFPEWKITIGLEQMLDDLIRANR